MYQFKNQKKVKVRCPKGLNELEILLKWRCAEIRSNVHSILTILHHFSDRPNRSKIRYYLAKFGSFRKNQTEDLQDKIKDERILRSFLEKYFFQKSLEKFLKLSKNGV